MTTTAMTQAAHSSLNRRKPLERALDGHLQSHMAVRLLRREDPKWASALNAPVPR
jgi:hypothetical protein